MSEIFEALLKAQREADERRTSTTGAPQFADSPSAGRTPAPPQMPPPAPPRVASARPRRRWALPKWGRSTNGHGHDTPLIMSAKAHPHMAEQFRVLRTHIESVGPCSVMVSSSLAGEGKTVCAVNLALTLSMRTAAGVILVDADLRHSSVGKYFGLAGRPGLVEYLLGEAEWEACLVSTPQARLRILPAGGHTVMAPELLGSERLHQLITGIRNQYPDHVVVFDGPPILLTADPMVMARHMDHIVLVVRAGMTPRDAVMKAVHAIGAERFIGVVLNGATDSLSDYYHYGRRYGYYGRPADAAR